MAYGFAFAVIALGGSLLYKGYRGWSWAQFYSSVLGSAGGTASSAASTASTAARTTKNTTAAKGG